VTCALCSADVPLCKSHIIPEFLYKTVYDEKHRLHCYSTDCNEPNFYEQKGLRQLLLCEECEQKISDWEGYARDVLLGGTALTCVYEDGLVNFKGVDYKKFKLFQLSILWRASVSNLDFFKLVNLGPHEKIVREMVLNSEPGDKYDYPCFALYLRNNGDDLKGLIVSPDKSRIEQSICYRFIFGGLIWVFVVSRSKKYKEIDRLFLCESGEMSINLRDIRNVPSLVSIARKLVDSKKI